MDELTGNARLLKPEEKTIKLSDLTDSQLTIVAINLENLLNQIQSYKAGLHTGDGVIGTNRSNMRDREFLLTEDQIENMIKK